MITEADFGGHGRMRNRLGYDSSFITNILKLFGVKTEKPGKNPIIEGLHQNYLSLSSEEKTSAYPLFVYNGNGELIELGFIVVGNAALKIYYYIIFGLNPEKKEIIIKKGEFSSVLIIHVKNKTDSISFEYIRDNSKKEYVFGALGYDRMRGSRKFDMKSDEFSMFVSDVKNKYKAEEKTIGFF